MRMIAAALALMLTTVPGMALAAEQSYPELNGRRVVDEADQIPEAEEIRLTDEIRAFQKRTGHEMVIVTIPDLEGVPEAMYANEIGRHWGIGRKGVDDGIVLLQSPGDGKPGSGKVFIAIGPGLQPTMTDAAGSVVYNEIMLPILKGQPGTSGAGLDRSARVVRAIAAGTAELLRRGAVTPEQKAEMDRRLSLQRERERQASSDSFWSVMTKLGLGVAAIGAGVVAWLLGTRKRRAKERAAEAERQRLLDIERAEQEREAKAERAAAEERRAQAEGDARRRREAMLAAMSPHDRQAFLDEEERQAEEARAEARRQDDERREHQRVEAEAAAQRQRERDAQDERDRATAAATAATTSTWNTSTDTSWSSPSPSPAPSPTPDFTPGGGTFDGGGAGGSY